MEKVTYDSYSFWYEGDWMFVKHNGKIQSIKVVDDLEFVFKLQKNQIRARGGAKELYEWMKNAIDHDDVFLTYVKQILYWVVFRKKKDA